MKIMIVEDEVIPANYLKKLIHHEGYEVLDIVERGADAIRIAQKETPNLILMDVMLKDNISGCDAALELSKTHPEILIVFLTAYSDKEMIDFAVASKAFGYLLKPYRENEILATLRLAEVHLGKTLSVHIKEKKKASTILHLVDGYRYDLVLKTLFKGTKEVPCGPKALQLIDFLCQHTHSTVKIDSILNHLWDSPKSQQTLRSLIHRIRENTSQKLIVNVNKLGYKVGLES